ncbi:hypothetical protein [Vibrio sp. 10N.237.312.B06]|uniref:hypothetical protein n=1 Tax=Vibrio sp. 10N.237.312.B06 TaxID=3229974 RepID=UPI00354D0181
MSVPIRTVTSISVLTTTLLLFGCGDNVADSLQLEPFSYINGENQLTQYEPSLTINQAFNHRKVCNEVEWQTFEDNRDRTVIEYRCNMDIPSQKFSNLLAAELNKSADKLAQRNSSEYKKIKKLADNQASYQEQYDEATGYFDKKRFENLLERSKRAQQELQEKYPDGIDGALAQLEDRRSQFITPVSVDEIYQWSVDDNEQSHFLYNGFSAHFSDDKTLSCEFDLFKSLNLLYKDQQAETYYLLKQTLKHWSQRLNFGGDDLIYLNDLKCQIQ